jgi:hypothetical protein
LEFLLSFIADSAGAATFTPPLRFNFGKGRDGLMTPKRPTTGRRGAGAASVRGPSTGQRSTSASEALGCGSVRERRIAAAEAADALRLKVMDLHGVPGLFKQLQTALDSPRSAGAGGVGSPASQGLLAQEPAESRLKVVETQVLLVLCCSALGVCVCCVWVCALRVCASVCAVCVLCVCGVVS